MANPFADWDDDKVAANNARVRAQNLASRGVGLPVNETLPPKAGDSIAKKAKGRREPNKTETAAYFYLKMCYPDASIRYEAITFQLEQGAAYTPDFVVFLPDNTMICYEIKNAAYRHASYGRSRLAFRQAALEFSAFTFCWLELQKNEWVLN